MSPELKKRFRVYSFAAGIVVALMASIPPLDAVDWPKVVVAVLGLAVGILNIRGKGQMDRFLIAAIGLKVTVVGFRKFPFLAEGSIPAEMLSNLEAFITAGLIYVSLVGLYEALQGNFTTSKKVVYAGATLLVLVAWNLGDYVSAANANIAALGLLIFGVISGTWEGPKSPKEASSGRGRQFLIAAVAFQLSSDAVAGIKVEEFGLYENFIMQLTTLLKQMTIFTTSALLVIAFMAIFWVLDEISDTS